MISSSLITHASEADGKNPHLYVSPNFGGSAKRIVTERSNDLHTYILTRPKNELKLYPFLKEETSPYFTIALLQIVVKKKLVSNPRALLKTCVSYY